MKKPGFILTALAITILTSLACRDGKDTALFIVREHLETGLGFQNTVKASADLNMIRYMYFFNGGGVGSADFNNDGLIDLFFTSNQGQNTLYLNKGKLEFDDVTTAARIPFDSAWNTGVSIVDINNDGLLDIYICRVGNFEKLQSKNQLLVCMGLNEKGIPFYEDQASKYGLDFSGFSTQAAFFDYDQDGDLDMFLLNHSVHQNETFAPRASFNGKQHPLSGDKLYNNIGGKFTDVTIAAGINSSAIGYGLGIAISDINMDGYPDIYIGNDFHENDYLYINQGNGTFREELNEHIMHTSQFSMGVDIGDINNDALPEIISVDMLPGDPGILRRSLGDDSYDIFNLKLKYGYNHQYARNNLQYNRVNGMFSEIGAYAGIEATDWSWAPLWLDFDNDGLKDLFISNGIQRRLNDIDYVNYISNEQVQSKILSGDLSEKDLDLVDNFPEIKIPNKFYSNRGELMFEDFASKVDKSRDTYSNGAAYADLDNDGDLDIVVNNVNDHVLLYENNSMQSDSANYVSVNLTGSSGNRNAIGSRLLLYSEGSILTAEKYPVRGFQSSMESPLHLGYGNYIVDSLLLIWPDNTYQHLHIDSSNSQLSVKYQQGLPLFNYTKAAFVGDAPLIKDVTDTVNLLYTHEENAFVEFDRESLIPHTLSAEGPALATGDINLDGLDDIFIGASRGKKPAAFIQNAKGGFSRSIQPALDNDSIYEDTDARWIDVNNDSFPDLVVVSGGNEYYEGDKFLLPRLYMNDTKGKLVKMPDAFTGVFQSGSCIVTLDFNRDGFPDLFIGSRSVPGEYGKRPLAHLLQNNGKGKFEDVTAVYSPDLMNAGFVTGAVVADLDKDGREDIIVATQWGGITAYMNRSESFTRVSLTERSGWWNFVDVADIDNDGDLDIIAGNMGRNSRLRASQTEPVRLYYGDFDLNGKKEQVLTYYINGQEVLFASKGELDKQIPILKKKFLYAEKFAQASPADVMGAKSVADAQILKADYFDNAILINNGEMNFTLKSLPWMAQFSAYRDAVICDPNNDGHPDILLAGNYFENAIRIGRQDADFGMLLMNNGKGWFTPQLPVGMLLKGQIRQMKKLLIAQREHIVFARNNDSVLVGRIEK